ncbi:MAG: SdpI family protein [Clostridiales bacterium]|nr:SdpI family protein [Clostridiales bacterium]
MTKTSRLIFIYSVINLICAIVFMFFLPDNVIFGLTGNLYASTYISRWYNLIIPITQVICMLVIYLLDVYNPKEHKYRYLISWVALAFTTYVMWVLMLLQYNNYALGVSLDWPWAIMILFPFGLFFIAEGYYTINKDKDDFSIFGYRWVKSNSIVWRQTHIIAGRSLIFVAFVLLIISVLNEIFWDTYWIYLVALLVWCVCHWLYTSLYAKSIADKYNGR